MSSVNLGKRIKELRNKFKITQDKLSKKADIPEAIYEHESGIKILPSSLSIKDLPKMPIDNLKSLKKDLAKTSDFVIVDCAAGLGSEALSAIELADNIIIVTNPEMPAITDALKTIKIAEKLKKPIMGIIITRVQKNNIELQPETVKHHAGSQETGLKKFLFFSNLRLGHC